MLYFTLPVRPARRYHVVLRITRAGDAAKVLVVLDFKVEDKNVHRISDFLRGRST